MGRVRTSRRRTSKNKQYKKRHDTKRRSKDIDQIQDEINKELSDQQVENSIDQENILDEDLPGMGQYYCKTCARYFGDEIALAGHILTKLHKRRIKDLAQPQYNQKEADLAAGKTIEILPPIHHGS